MIRRLKRLIFQSSDWLKEALLVIRLSIPIPQRFSLRRETVPVIASLTSYPARIGQAWLAIETLLRQTVRPNQLLLVLSREEFPEQKLPSKIINQTRRGLTVLWVDNNGKSFDKLLPARALFPGETIVTFDDDKYFPPSLLENLLKASQTNPSAVIGARGWSMRESTTPGEIHYGSNWKRTTPGEKGDHVLTPGGNGCLYPPDSLSPLVDSLDSALKHCPTADDIWFWGALRKKGTPILSLGMKAHRPVRFLKKSRALSDVNEEANDAQFQNVIKHFSLSTPSLMGPRKND